MLKPVLRCPTLQPASDLADFPLLRPPPPYSVVVTPATPSTPPSHVRLVRR